jgi:holliday junction DNA helicase RuvA
MYAYISGKLTYKEPALAVIETGGVGYDIRIPLSAFSLLKVAETCTLYTYLHVKEDAHTLYGFLDQEDKKLFLLLIGISGVGPGTAMMVLSSLSAQEIKEAIVREDVRTIQGIKGIGIKTAQRLILELKDKIKKDGLIDASLAKSPQPLAATAIQAEALNALVMMGLARPQAEKSIASIIKKFGSGIALEELIKQALKGG